MVSFCGLVMSSLFHSSRHTQHTPTHPHPTLPHKSATKCARTCGTPLAAPPPLRVQARHRHVAEVQPQPILPGELRGAREVVHPLELVHLLELVPCRTRGESSNEWLWRVRRGDHRCFMSFGSEVYRVLYSSYFQNAQPQYRSVHFCVKTSRCKQYQS